MKRTTLLLSALLLILSCQPDEPVPQPPQARFTVENNFCTAPCELRFTSTSEHAVKHTWDFGDGEGSKEENPAHTYKFSGSYEVTLEVEGQSGSTARYAKIVTVVADNEFITGMDLSYQPYLELRNTAYFESDGTAIPDLLSWAGDNGANLIRLRLFHTPSSPDFGVAYCDLSSMLAYGKRIKADGNQFLLDIHYSDFWADPGKQYMPAAWTGLSFEVLQDSVYAYTYDVLDKFHRENALPDMIQIGNETNPGFLWPEGRLDWNDPASWQKYVQLVHAARRAVLDIEAKVDRDIQIVLHYAGDNGALAFFENLKDEGALYDIIGLSHYPFYHTQNLAVMQVLMRDLATSIQKPILIAETSYPFTLDWNDWTNNVVGEERHLVSGYPATPAGQKSYYEFWVNMLKNVPDGRGLGFVWWAPDLVAFDGPQSYEGSAFENLCVFDFDNKALPVMDVFREN